MRKEFFTVKTWLVKQEITEKMFDAMDAEATAKFYNELNENNGEAFKELQEAVSKGEAEATEVTEALKAQADLQKEQITRVFSAMEKQGLALSKLMKAGMSDVQGVTIEAQLKANTDEIKIIAKGDSSKEVAIKDIANRATVDGRGTFDLPTIGQIGTRTISIYNLFAKISISGENTAGTIKYYDWDEATIARNAAMIAEGTAFPESKVKWKSYTLDIQKVGDSIPVTEEFFEDESMFASELEFFLRTNVDLKIDEQLLNGNGLAANLTGLTTSAPVYVPVASGISDPSRYDLLVKVREDIVKDRGAKYAPNFAIMNIVEITAMQLKKDANNNYIIPPFVTKDGKEVAGMMIVENNGMAAGEMIIGDNKFAKIYEIGGFTMAKGEVNNQFLEDTMTLKIRKRLALLVREVDKSGFRHVTDIDAALTTIGT